MFVTKMYKQSIKSIIIFIQCFCIIHKFDYIHFLSLAQFEDDCDENGDMSYTPYYISIILLYQDLLLITNRNSHSHIYA